MRIAPPSARTPVPCATANPTTRPAATSRDDGKSRVRARARVEADMPTSLPEAAVHHSARDGRPPTPKGRALGGDARVTGTTRRRGIETRLAILARRPGGVTSL